MRVRGRLRKTILELSSYFRVLTLTQPTLIIGGVSCNNFAVLDVLTPQAPGLLSRAFSADGARRANALATAGVENEAVLAARKRRSATSPILLITEAGKRAFSRSASAPWLTAGAADAAVAVE